MHREQIKELALNNGFKLKPQPDGSEDLNPYVYEFAAALTEHMQQQNDYLSALASGQPLYGLEEKIRDLMARNKALQAEVERLSKDKRRIDAIEANYWDVRYSGDSGEDVVIEIIGHFMANPCERVVGEDYCEDLRAAIDQAMKADAYPPARPEYEDSDKGSHDEA